MSKPLTIKILLCIVTFHKFNGNNLCGCIILNNFPLRISNLRCFIISNELVLFQLVAHHIYFRFHYSVSWYLNNRVEKKIFCYTQEFFLGSLIRKSLNWIHPFINRASEMELWNPFRNERKTFHNLTSNESHFHLNIYQKLMK